MMKAKCPYGECKYLKNGKCTKEKEISELSMEELIETMVTKTCRLREEK